MKRFGVFLLALGLTLLSACVTINVYFPAAAAEKAAEQFIGKVIGEAADADPPKSGDAPAPRQPPQASLLDLLIPAAHAAEPDLNIQTPAVREIQARMKQRFDTTLTKAFAAGTIGMTGNGLVAMRDAASVPLSERAALTQALADENRDRAAVYREIAVANGHPEWESQIQSTFARQWIERARPGWYYQDPTGSWKQR
ncbi:YdbL family protein [Tahibacter amnicola]|uniref:YdbL family protein n=1 Tax=Tahibacter amnicola TaxID=2976241 RepID=A0ABY6BIS5_9GAMM|nr:YdbL family protein [Tahibacter amnicola]UXI69669.1 YdbL family protein [Tahibacter amnicola]